jgi:hypothetical protein
MLPLWLKKSSPRRTQRYTGDAQGEMKRTFYERWFGFPVRFGIPGVKTNSTLPQDRAARRFSLPFAENEV